MAEDGSNSPRPFAWAVIPIAIVFFGCFTGSLIYIRRRRRRSPDFVWPRERTVNPSGGRRVGNRWVPWGNTRSQEGLNELGEAPPPYDGQKNPAEADGVNGDASGRTNANRDGSGSRNSSRDASDGVNVNGNNHRATTGGATGNETGTELRDLEAGVLPPAYLTEPAPAVTRDSRRSDDRD